MSASHPLLSIVSPVFNEQDNLVPLYERLCDALAETAFEWELILVDDGSTDDSGQRIRELRERDTRVMGVFLSRNFGHELASTAGLDAARGDAVVLMDADLQDPPELIPALIEQWREGYNVVSAQRARRRNEPLFKRATAYLFYRVMNLLVGWELPKDTGDFRLMDRLALDAFRNCRERNRFVRALVAWTGFRQTTVAFERPARVAGSTKYRPWHMLALALTSVTGFSVAPLRIATGIGLLVVALSSVTVLGILTGRIFGAHVPVNVAVVASVWFLGGVQCLLVGIVGEYVGRIYTECQHRPLYIVRERLGLEEREDGREKGGE